MEEPLEACHAGWAVLYQIEMCGAGEFGEFFSLGYQVKGPGLEQGFPGLEQQPALRHYVSTVFRKTACLWLI